MYSTKLRAGDPAEIERALRLILQPGQVTELRALDAVTASDRRPHTISGYFDDPAKLAAAAGGIVSAKGIYFVPNPIQPALLARSMNKARAVGKDPTTGDADILRRLWLLIDCDAVRAAGIAASDDEHTAALSRATDIDNWLCEQGWLAAIVADSGNGGHLLYGIDVAADDGGLIQRCLTALALRFDDHLVKVDTSVFNPARIWKLYGTLAGKGDADAAAIGRPHRMARILNAPERLDVVTVEQLGALAAHAPQAATTPARTTAATNSANGKPFEVADWIRRHGLDVNGPQAWRENGRRWIFRACPWNADHTNGSAFIVEWPDGTIGAGCHHNSCQGRDWHALRDAVEPGWRERTAHNTQAHSAETARPSFADPQPLPSDMPAVQPFDYDLLPRRFRAWIQDIAERIQCPPDFPAVAATIALAAIVGRKVGIRPKRRDDWLVVPNLWGAAIGRPGVMKTPAIAEPLKPLKRLEIEAKRRFVQGAAEHDAAKMVRDASRKVGAKAIESAVKKDPTAALEIARGLVDECDIAPVRRRYITNDSTVEKTGEILNQNPNGVLQFRDELTGLLRSLDKEGQEGARAFYLEAWNGTGRYTYDRIGRGTLDIEAAILSMLGGIQPGPLRDYLREVARGGRGDDGLIQRIQLAVWPDFPKHWRNVDAWPDSVAKQTAYDVFTRLDELSPLAIGANVDADEPDGIPWLRFSDEAQNEFDQWRERLELRLRSDIEHPTMESHLAKYRSLIPSLALLIHLADGGCGAVDVDAIRRAITWGKYLESHARRIYGIAVNADEAAARELGQRIKAGELANGFALRDVYRRGWSGLSRREDAAAAVELLIDLNWLQAVENPTAGRTATRHYINPKILAAAPQGTDKTDRSPHGRPECAPFVSSVSRPPAPSLNPAPDTDNINRALADAAEVDTAEF